MKPHPSHYNGAILKKLAVFLKKVDFFAFIWDAARKKNVFAVWKALLKLGGSSGVWDVGRGTGCG